MVCGRGLPRWTCRDCDRAIWREPPPDFRQLGRGADQPMQRLLRLTGVLLVLAAATRAHAGIGQPSPWQTGFQYAATPVMADVVWLHNVLLYIITAVAGFVLVLLVIVIVRFNQRANPLPA